MTSHTVSAFDKQIENVIGMILQMGGLVMEMLELAEKSLSDANPELAESAKSKDKQINALDMEIQEQATLILALRQPMGVDLRFVTASLRVASSLERMGDLAKSTAKRAVKFADAVPKEITADLRKMVELASKMARDVLEAFRDQDVAKADLVLAQDDAVDDIYHRLLASIQTYMMANPVNIQYFAHIIFVAKNMERVGDHATTIADLVHYISSGSHAAKAPKTYRQ